MQAILEFILLSLFIFLFIISLISFISPFYTATIIERFHKVKWVTIIVASIQPIVSIVIIALLLVHIIVPRFNPDLLINPSSLAQENYLVLATGTIVSVQFITVLLLSLIGIGIAKIAQSSRNNKDLV